jgi:CubicO group peptidase (beta-lactamase class C family)
MKSQSIPGLALAVANNGQIIKAAGYGLANIQLEIPVSPDTVFPHRLDRQAVRGHRNHAAR